MIQIQINAINGSREEIPFKYGETYDELIERALNLNDIDATLLMNIRDSFVIILDGYILDKELWGLLEVSEKSNVLIAPHLTGGNFRETFKTIAVLAVVIGVTYLSAGNAAWVTAAWAGGASVAAALILNDVLPPILPTDGIGTATRQANSSQMYNVSGQSNAVDRYGSVLKVYGEHKVYPRLATNPYTELSVFKDAKGKSHIAQYFVAVYDVGQGEYSISDLKIGDTPITSFEDIIIKYVDPNKSLTETYSWNKVLTNKFTYYKGDVEQDTSQIALNANENDASFGDDFYTVIRNAAPNPTDTGCEILLNFVAPQGMVCYGTNGVPGRVQIEFDIKFSKISENVWRSFNDVTYVSNFNVLGGDGAQGGMEKLSLGPVNTLSYAVQRLTLLPLIYVPSSDFHDSKIHNHEIRRLAFVKGQTLIALKSGTFLTTNDFIQIGDEYYKITSKTLKPELIPGYYDFTLDRGLEEDYIVWQAETYDNAFIKPFTETTTGKNIFGVTRTNGVVVITEENTDPVYFQVRFTLRNSDDYKIRITRKRTIPEFTYRVLSNITMYNLQTRFVKKPIATSKRHLFLELRIRATNQINGNIQNLSCVAQSALPYWDTNTNTWKKKLTSNPAWVFVDILTGIGPKKVIDKSRLDIDSILDFANYCDEIPALNPPNYDYILPRYTSNFVLDYSSTVSQLINTVLSATQASLNIIDGKYGVLLDVDKTVPVQVFTPRNSWGFSSSRTYSDEIHAIKAKYVDRVSNWEVNEVIVYDTGFNKTNATRIEEVTTFAVTNAEQAFRFARFTLAKIKARRETVNISVDFENLVCGRGDLVYFTHDVMKSGGIAFRVKAVSGNTVTIDAPMDFGPYSYGYTFRNATTGIYTNTITVINATSFTVNGTVPSVGDLIIVGEVGFVTFPYLIKSINPNDTLSATLTLVEQAPDIYDYEYATDFPDYEPNLNPSRVDSDFAPSEVTALTVTANTWEFISTNYQYYIELDWISPITGAVDIYEIYADNGSGLELVSTTKDTAYKYIVNPLYLGVEHSFKVLALSATGKKLNLIDVGSVEATPEEKTTRPSDVDRLNLNITNEVLQFSWVPISDVDVKEYLIRYSVNLEGTWETSIPLLKVDRFTSMVSTQARTGSYFIKAIDYNNNESSTASKSVTTIPELFNLNIIETIDDFPTLNGVMDRVEEIDGYLTLQRKQSGGVYTNEYFEFGYYYYENFLDLGDLYSVRLQANIEAEGFTLDDMMSSWPNLEDLLFMSGAKFSEWDVQLEYRTTEAFNVIADWVTLDSVTSLNEGASDIWSDWRQIASITDATGRIFQFRLKLISNKASVTPRVIQGNVRADMADRIERFDNVTSSVLGTTVTYNFPFKGPANSPVIQITAEDMETGDYWVIENKTLNSFDITFYNSSNVAIVRIFDVMVSGYGRKTDSII